MEVITSTHMGKFKMISLDRAMQIKWLIHRQTQAVTALKVSRLQAESSSSLSRDELEVCRYQSKIQLFKSNLISQDQHQALALKTQLLHLWSRVQFCKTLQLSLLGHSFKQSHLLLQGRILGETDRLLPRLTLLSLKKVR